MTYIINNQQKLMLLAKLHNFDHWCKVPIHSKQTAIKTD